MAMNRNLLSASNIEDYFALIYGCLVLDLQTVLKYGVFLKLF